MRQVTILHTVSHFLDMQICLLFLDILINCIHAFYMAFHIYAKNSVLDKTICFIVWSHDELELDISTHVLNNACFSPLVD